MATRAVPAPLAQLPNALTLGRLALIPLFVVFMVQAGDAHTWPAGIVWLIAGVTDQIDGFLARRWHVESRFGKIADPVADRRVLSPRGIDLDVNVLGKAATWLLYLGLGCRMVTHDHTSWPLWIFWVGLGMAVVAAMFYVRDAWRELR